MGEDKKIEDVVKKDDADGKIAVAGEEKVVNGLKKETVDVQEEEFVPFSEHLGELVEEPEKPKEKIEDKSKEGEAKTGEEKAAEVKVDVGVEDKEVSTSKNEDLKSIISDAVKSLASEDKEKDATREQTVSPFEKRYYDTHDYATRVQQRYKDLKSAFDTVSKMLVDEGISIPKEFTKFPGAEEQQEATEMQADVAFRFHKSMEMADKMVGREEVDRYDKKMGDVILPSKDGQMYADRLAKAEYPFVELIDVVRDFEKRESEQTKEAGSLEARILERVLKKMGTKAGDADKSKGSGDKDGLPTSLTDLSKASGGSVKSGGAESLVDGDTPFKDYMGE